MDFDTLDKQMRRFEQSLDRTIPDGIYMVARLDGHGFTRLTKKEWDLEKPFDKRFCDAMVETLAHLMTCGFRVIYGYTESDEISLLFHIDEEAFGRKERKLVSILAAEASVKFSLAVGRLAVFDCRLVPLPTAEDVVDYFRWRMEDAHRNSLSAHCYWLLRKIGIAPADVQKKIAGLSSAEKNELLFTYGINYDTLPAWQRRGVGMLFNDVEQEGYNPKTHEPTKCVRRQLSVGDNLPTGQEYSDIIMSVLKENPHASK